MARQVINRGNFPNDHAHADPIYVINGKINDMTADIYARLSRTISVGDIRFVAGATTEAKGDLAVAQALAELAFYVEWPAFMLPYDITLMNQANLTAFAASGGRLTREGGDPSVYDVLAYGGAVTDTVDSVTPAALAVKAAIATNGGRAVWGNASTSRIASGVTYTTGWELGGTGASGLQGIALGRSAQGLPVGLTLKDGGVKIWDTVAIDATSHDLVLAYSYIRSADMLRIDEQAHFMISDTSGAPDPTIRLTLESTAADSAGTATMLRINVASGSPLDAVGKILFQANVAGVIKAQITRDGQMSMGVAGGYAGTLTGGSLEVAKGAVLIATNADPVLWLAVRGTNTRDWLIRVSNATSRQIEIVENNTGLRPVIIRPSSLDAAIFMDGSNGGLQLGVAASKLGFYGHAVIALQTIAAAASDPATTQTLANDLRAKLIALGLVQ